MRWVAILVCLFVGTRAAHADRDACLAVRAEQQRQAQATVDLAERTRLLTELPDCGPPPAPPAPPAPPPPPERGTPPLSGSRIGHEVVAGVLGMGVGVALGVFLPCSGILCGDAEFDAILGAAAFGSILMPIGVYVAGNRGDQHGSGGFMVLGDYLGLLGAVGIANLNPTAGVVAICVLPLAGAIAGFNLSRDYDAAPSIGTAVSFRRGRPRVGVPLIARDAEGHTYVSLLAGRF